MKKPGRGGEAHQDYVKHLKHLRHARHVRHQKYVAQHPAAAAAAKKKAAITKAHKHKARGWSPDEAVALCSARAVAESLRLTLGVAVSHDDVLALYWLVADDPDTGASILAMLEAAQEHGLSGHRPVGFHRVAGPLHEANERLIIGADLPQPHALATDGATWWSWGEPYSPEAFPGAVVEEAWEVTWA